MLNISGIISKFVKNSSQRDIEKLKSTVEKINNWESRIKEIPDENFPSKTEEFKSKIKKGMPLDDLLPETFATGFVTKKNELLKAVNPVNVDLILEILKLPILIL